MKKLFLYFIPLLFLFACKKQDLNSDFSETITSGSKWGIKIGSSAAQVYTQLQQADAEKNIGTVDIINRKVFTNPDEIKNFISFYSSVIISNKNNQTDNVSFQFPTDKITYITVSNALVQKWPQNIADVNTIHQDDLASSIPAKLVEISKLPAYNNYQLYINMKPLSKPFDPDMANYSQWLIYFYTEVKPGRSGRSRVMLNFKNGSLQSIVHEYKVSDYLD